METAEEKSPDQLYEVPVSGQNFVPYKDFVDSALLYGGFVRQGKSVSDLAHNASEAQYPCFTTTLNSECGCHYCKHSITKEEALSFKDKLSASGLSCLNFVPIGRCFKGVSGDHDKKACHKAVAQLIEDLEFASQLGCRWLALPLTETGQADKTEDEIRIARILSDALCSLHSCNTGIALIQSPGSVTDTTVGDTLESLASVISNVSADVRSRVGIAFHSANCWVSGYDISHEDGVAKFWEDWGRIIPGGMLRLVAAFLSDTAEGRGSHVTSPTHIGGGRIGFQGFGALVRHSALRRGDICCFVDVPEVDMVPSEIAALIRIEKGEFITGGFSYTRTKMPQLHHPRVRAEPEYAGESSKTA